MGREKCSCGTLSGDSRKEHSSNLEICPISYGNVIISPSGIYAAKRSVLGVPRQHPSHD